MTKVVILGMNRCGTKLASYIVAEGCHLDKVFLEPFTWDRGIDANASMQWQAQQELRKRSPEGRQEHAINPLISTKSIFQISIK